MKWSRNARLILRNCNLVAGVAAAFAIACNSQKQAPVQSIVQAATGSSCSFTVTKNVYDGPQWWGTITFRNDGPDSASNYKVEFDVPDGAHCTAEPESVPTGATLTPLTGSNPAHTVSNHCVFTWTNATPLAPGSSKTFNYSADSQSFSAATGLVVSDLMCGGGQSATCACSGGSVPRPACYTTASPAAINGARVLFVVPLAAARCSDIPNDSDRALCDHMEARGAKLTVVSDGDSNLTNLALARDLVVVSETVSSTHIGNKLTNVPVAVVSLEARLFDDLKMTASRMDVDFGYTIGSAIGKTIEVQPNNIFAQRGPTQVYFANAEMSYGAPGRVAVQGAKILATLPHSGERAAIFAYETGAALAGGGVAPAPRAGFFAVHDTAVQMTPDGWAMFDQLIDSTLVCQLNQCLGACTTATSNTCSCGCGTFQKPSCFQAPPSKSLSGAKILYVADGASHCTDLTHSWDRSLCAHFELAGSIVTTVNASAADLATRAASFDLVFVSEGADSNAVDGKLRDVAVPVVTSEPLILDDLRMVKPTTSGGVQGVDFGFTASTNKLDRIFVAESPFFGPAGSMLVLSQPRQMGWGAPGRGTPGQQARIIATLADDGSHATVFAYAAGDMMAGGIKAPASRAAFFTLQDASDFLTADGFNLLDRVVAGALSCQGCTASCTSRCTTGCAGKQNGDSCDDGDPCNGTATCAAGICQDQAPAPKTTCDDGDPTTRASMCEAGICRPDLFVLKEDQQGGPVDATSVLNQSVVATTPFSQTDRHTFGATRAVAMVNAHGSSQVTIPIRMPPGRAGLEPSLALSYVSGNGDGLLGVGWSLGMSQINRCPKTVTTDGLPAPIKFDNTDALCWDGRRLVLVSGTAMTEGAVYRTEEDIFAKIIAHAPDTQGPTWFEIRTKDGRILHFGDGPNGRVEGQRAEWVRGPDPVHTPAVVNFVGTVRLGWALSRIRDRSGNAILFKYKLQPHPEDENATEHVPDQILYTTTDSGDGSDATKSVSFGWTDRATSVERYVNGLKLLSRKLLTTLTVASTGYKHSYNLAYANNSITGRPLLQSIEECDELTSPHVCLPATKFDWELGQGGFSVSDAGLPDIGQDEWDALRVVPMDVNGDGRTDLVYTVFDRPAGLHRWKLRLAQANGTFGPPSDPGLPPWPSSFSGQGGNRYYEANGALNAVPTDINLDGKADLLVHMKVITGQSVYRIFEFDGSKFVAKFTSGEGISANQDSEFLLADTDGDALPDIYRFNRTGMESGDSGGFYLESDGQWLVRGVGAANVESDHFIQPGTDLGRVKLGATHVVDIDGDGIAEILSIRGKSDPQYKAWSVFGIPTAGDELPGTTRVRPTTLFNAGELPFSSTGVTAERALSFFDPNGDGLPDAFFSFSERIAINSGNGFSGEFSSGITARVLPSITDTITHPFDYDNDGRGDLLVTCRFISQRNKATVIRSIGRSVEAIEIPDVPCERDTGLTYGVLDRDGDGNQEFIYFDNNLHKMRIQERTNAKTDLLHRVTDGQGEATEFLYDRYPEHVARLAITPATCSYPSYCVPPQMWVAATQTIDATGPSPRLFLYRYEDSRSDVLGRGWLGFGKRIVTEAATGVESEEQYDNATRSGIGFARPIPSSNFVELFAYPFAGKVTKTITRVPLSGLKKGTFVSDAPLKLFAKAAGSLTLPPYYFVASETNTTSYYEGTTYFGETPAPALVNSTVTKTTWDQDTGNVSHRETTWSNGDKLTVDTTFDDSQSDWLIGRTKDVTAVEATALGDTGRREAHYTYETGTQLVHTRTRGPAAVEVVDTFEHNTDGTLASSTRSGVADLLGTRQDRKTSFLYQDFDRTRPSHLIDANGQATRIVFNPGTGQTVFVRDPNGHESKWTHDGMARLLTADLPDDADVTYAYETPVKGVVAVHETRAGGAESIVETDRLGRVVLTKDRLHGGKFSRRETTYDARGRVQTVSPPFLDGTAVPTSLTTYGYDNLDRYVSIQPAGLGMTTFVHDKLKTTATTALGFVHEYTQDQLGRPAQRLDKIEGRDVITKYAYSPFDQVKSATDPLNNVTSYGYDDAGRLTSSVDLNAGTSTLVYNAFDEVISETRAGRTRTSRYDILGRFIHSDSPDGPRDLVWDQAEHGQGLMSSAVSPQGIQDVFEYDAFSRLRKRSVSVGSATYSATRDYDTFGRLQTLTYPESSTSTPYSVTLGYSPNNGALVSITDPGAVTIWKATEFDQWGRVKESALGSKGKVAQTFDQFTGLLRQTTTQSVSATATTTIEDFAFKFDDDGRLQQRTDQGLARTEDFVHDSVDRLSSWTKTPTGGTSALMSYTYDDIGNLKKKIPQGGTTETFDYEGAAVGAGPHAVTKSAKGNYRYDAAGNRTSDPSGTMTYTFFELPIQQKRGTATVNFQYDAFEQRVSKQTSSGTSTVYVDGLFELRTEGGQTFEILHLPIPDGPGGFIRRTGGTNDQLFYASTDHLGSTTAILDGNANLIERRRTDPWGLSSTPINQSASPYRQLFTGQEHDAELDAINYNGRIYDPYTTRFLTADPVVSDVFGFASHNRYAYVSNSPLNFTDPTGFQAGPDDDDPVAILRAKAPPPVTAAPQQEPLPAEGPSSGSTQGQVDLSFLGPPTSLGADFGRSEAERLANPIPGGGPAGGGEAAAEFAKGVAVGAATSVATTVVLSGISAVCPVCGLAIGVALLAKTVYDLANGGLAQTIESTGRIFSGEGTAEDYYNAGALLGSIAAGKAMGAKGGGGPRKPTGPSGPPGPGGGGTTRVSRWMSTTEHDTMVKTGMVQESHTGTTHVAHPAAPEAFMNQAKVGSVHVEFDVPATSVRPTQAGWGKIVGPNSLEGRLAKRKGLPVPQMPPATNIQHTATKIR